MHTDAKTYRRYAQARSRKSPLLRDMLFAYVSGGSICVVAQFLKNIYLSLGMTEESAGSAVSVSLIAAAILLTAFGCFDRIAKKAGAGTLVPITGFANAVASSAIDARSEGFVMGVGAKIFPIAGPVIAYGLAAGTVYGVIYWVISLL
ncbi:MAG: SpoVA/SpoVAEb family sporulation membrane protein [Clostridia bacterium]|nr:SpoVA/SpoVAEb family sporulation membrane protein [Clostridia bacterium]